MDGDLFETLLHCRLDLKKDKTQRPACGCVQSVDIGMYNSCAHACRYCYANYSMPPRSPLTAKGTTRPLRCSIGKIGQMDRVTERVMHSCKEQQMALVGF